MTTKTRTQSLAYSLNSVPEVELVPSKFLTGGAVTARITYGQDMSLMTATRDPGYHSRPHIHDSEQLNYVLAGELYVFIDEVAIHIRKGDVFRVPRNAVHWSWVQGNEPCTLLEVHTPPLLGDPGLFEGALPLAADDETLDPQKVPSEWPQEFDRDAAEKVALAKLRSTSISTRD